MEPKVKARNKQTEAGDIKVGNGIQSKRIEMNIFF